MAATVSDDASKWTAKQFYTATNSGNWKDPEGELHAFGTFQALTMDFIDLLQQVSGQKAIFWLDSPGHSYFADYPVDQEPIDSIGQVEQFTSEVCNRFDICTHVNWFVDLTVDPGAILDTVQTQAGLGSESNP